MSAQGAAPDGACCRLADEAWQNVLSADPEKHAAALQLLSTADSTASITSFEKLEKLERTSTLSALRTLMVHPLNAEASMAVAVLLKPVLPRDVSFSLFQGLQPSSRPVRVPDPSVTDSLCRQPADTERAPAVKHQDVTGEVGSASVSTGQSCVEASPTAVVDIPAYLRRAVALGAFRTSLQRAAVVGALCLYAAGSPEGATSFAAWLDGNTLSCGEPEQHKSAPGFEGGQRSAPRKKSFREFVMGRVTSGAQAMALADAWEQHNSIRAAAKAAAALQAREAQEAQRQRQARDATKAVLSENQITAPSASARPSTVRPPLQGLQPNNKYEADQACSQVTPARNMPMPSPTQDDISLPFAWVEDPDASGCLWLISPNAHHVKRATSPVQDALQACTTPSPYHSVPLEPPSSPGQAWPQMTAADCISPNVPQGQTLATEQELFRLSSQDGSEACVTAEQVDCLLPPMSLTSPPHQTDLAVYAARAAPSLPHAGPNLQGGAAADCTCPAMPDSRQNGTHNQTPASKQELFRLEFHDGSEAWVSAEQLDSLLPALTPEDSCPDVTVCTAPAAPGLIHAGPHLQGAGATAGVVTTHVSEGLSPTQLHDSTDLMLPEELAETTCSQQPHEDATELYPVKLNLCTSFASAQSP